MAALVSHSLQSATQGTVASLGVPMDCTVVQIVELRGNDRSSGAALCSKKSLYAIQFERLDGDEAVLRRCPQHTFKLYRIEKSCLSENGTVL